jgi:hypothetical protein
MLAIVLLLVLGLLLCAAAGPLFLFGLAGFGAKEPAIGVISWGLALLAAAIGATLVIYNAIQAIAALLQYA